MDDETTVEIELDGTPEDGVHKVHIHAGTCDDLGEAITVLRTRILNHESIAA